MKFTSLNNKNHFDTSFTELAKVIPFLILALLLLLPQNFESGGGECYNEWAAAKMFLDGYGFPVTYISTTYVIYSAILLSLFEYTNFILLLIFSFFIKLIL